MCHTLLQHYIPCRHSSVHFVSCFQSQYDTLPPPLPGDFDPPARTVQPDNVPAEWRDHSQRKGVSHSYQRLCPECLEEKVAKDEESRKARRRERGVDDWREWAWEHGMRGVDDDDEGDDEGSDGDLGFGELRRNETDIEVEMEEYVGRRRLRSGRRDTQLPSASLSVDQDWNVMVEGGQVVLHRFEVEGTVLETSMQVGENAVPRGFSGRRTPGAERSRRPRMETGLPQSPQVGTGNTPARTRRRARESGQRRVSRQPDRQRPASSLGARTLSGQIERQQILTDIQQLAELRRTWMFQAAQRYEQRLQEDAAAAIANTESSQAEIVQAWAAVEALARAPPITAQPSPVVSARQALSRNAGQNLIGEALRDAERRGTWQRLPGEEYPQGTIGLVPYELSIDGAFSSRDIVEDRGGRDAVVRTPIDNDEPSENDGTPDAGGVGIFDSTETRILPSTAATSTHLHLTRSLPPTFEPTVSQVRSGSASHLGYFSHDVHDYMRDCPHHASDESDTPCNDPTHLGKTPREDSIEVLRRSRQHGTHLRLHRGSVDGLCDDVWEILVKFEACDHYNVVFVERLSYSHDTSISATCGCVDFDKCLVGARRTQSREFCLKCRKQHIRRGQPNDGTKSELFCWFGRYVRAPESSRTVGLWPFGAQSQQPSET